jgi:hypothetical protein
MPTIKIGDRLVGDGQPTYIIAEVGVNHNGILQLAFELIDAAVDAGADAVKFQKRDLESLYSKKYLDNANAGEKTLRYLLPILQRVELSDEDYYRLVEYCQRKKITFLCSAFDSKSADFLAQLGVPAFKVASADLTNLPLLDHLIALGKPMILSTGMSRMDEVEFTAAFLKKTLTLVLWSAYASSMCRWATLGMSAVLLSRPWRLPSGPASSSAISPLTAPWTAPITLPVWSRTAFAKWCETSGRWPWQWVAVMKNSSRAARY